MDTSIRRLTPLCLAVSCLVGCEFQPSSAPMRFALSETTVEALEPVKQDQLRGALEMLFGTPQNPGYMLLPDWAEDGFDPNWPTYPEDDLGSGEFTDEELDELWEDNRRRFADQLAAIEEGRYAEVGYQIAAPALNANWDALLAEHEAGELTEEELAEEGTLLFEEYYPRLSDSAELYRQQCLHCHGVEGGGDGPTAGTREKPYLNPLPRDYRKGVFKYTAVKDKAMPRREDLYTILDQGIYSTAMPNFRRFSKAERHGLVDYVRLLSIRGMVEERLALAVLDEEPLTPELVQETFSDVWEKWEEADSKLITFDGPIPEPTPELLARGKELFNDATTGNCMSCHGPQGLGDGVGAWKVDEEKAERNRLRFEHQLALAEARDYDAIHEFPSAPDLLREVHELAADDSIADEDERQQRIVQAIEGYKALAPAYEDDWGNPIIPRNLRRGIFRFGRRPIDIYRRVYAGINGGPMPAIGESRGADGELLLSSDDLWAIVHYVRSLSETAHPLVAGGGVAPWQEKGDGHGDAHGASGTHGPDGHDAHDDHDATPTGAGH
jgi:mono/diheme cytochrome c family protein